MTTEIAGNSLFLKIAYPAVVFLSAFLLLQLEPMAGKLLLPTFGGSAGVWSVCLFFFQLVLLAGYAYAYLITAVVTTRQQIAVHLTLLAMATLTLPVWSRGISQAANPHDPSLSILRALVLGIGAPFFLLSATNPLLQSWRSRRAQNENTYKLYAFSNAGSLLGLLTYPFLFEVLFSLGRLAKIWSVCFGIFGVLCAIVGLRAQGEPSPFVAANQSSPLPTWPIQARWIAFPACASASLLAITNHITQDLASVPLLWIVPLGLYLLSFVLCFMDRSVYRRQSFVRWLALALVAMVAALAVPQVALHSLVTTGIFCAGLFVCCTVCHGELFLLRPPHAHLARYYLFAALGGVLGSAFVALLAPHLFAGFYELPISLGCCGLIARSVAGTRSEPAPTGSATVPISRTSLILFVVLCLSLYRIMKRQEVGLRLSARNFFGVLRVEDHTSSGGTQLPGIASESNYRELLNGTTNHGLQFLDPQRSREATTYYGPASGVAIALNFHRPRTLHIGVVGLGAGTLAVYGRPGDVYTFYEVNPLVVSLATSEFSFLSGSAAQSFTVVGDGRLSLERDVNQHFDLLAVDAFSGDAVPTHLLTREAFLLYRARLRPGGVLAVHITNKYLDLAPVVLAAAASLHWDAVIVDSKGDPGAATLPATWVLLGASPEVLKEVQYAGDEMRTPSVTHADDLWTDDYSSLIRTLKW